MRRLATLAALAVLLPAHVALAQSPTTSATSSGLVGLNLASNSIAAVNTSEAAQAGGAGTARKYIPRVFGGLIFGDNATGFTVGGGVSLHPFTDARHEIQGNAAFNRVEGTNGFGLDVDYLYNLTNVQLGTFTPYLGGGLNFMRFSSGECNEVEDDFDVDLDCSSSDASLQVGGGVKKPLANGKNFFGEAYIVLSDSTLFMIRAGLGW